MADWCSNALIVTNEYTNLFGDVKVAVLTDKALAKDQMTEFISKFDVENFMSQYVPIPDELRFFTGYAVIDGIGYTAWRLLVDSDGQSVQEGINEEKLDELALKYGARDWYAWNMCNWGCKSDVNAEIITKGPITDKLHILFDSPYSPPELFVRTISRMYPDLIFELAYAEEGMDFWGTTVFHNGSVVYHTYNEDGLDIKEHCAKYSINLRG